MPQMMPLNWFILFMYTLMILLMIMVSLNFMVMYVNNYKNVKINKLSYKWLW